jgi:hypothetical protein
LGTGKISEWPRTGRQRSTYLSVSSENPKVAAARAADNRIYITSIRAGQTRLAVTYSLGGGQQKLLYVPVMVRSDEPQEIEISPATWDFGDVRSNSSNSSRQVTITNHLRTDVRLYKIESPGFLISNDNCSNRVLAPSACCTLAVTFQPTAPGPVQGTLLVPNSHSTVAASDGRPLRLIVLFTRGLVLRGEYKPARRSGTRSNPRVPRVASLRRS